jgi:PAS domain S-box-containing protein
MPNRLRRRQQNAPSSAPGDLTNEALLSALVESSDDAIITKDLSGKILTWNLAAGRMYGYSAAEAIGRPITIIVPEDHAADVWLILRTISAGERVRPHETVRNRKDGTRINVSLTVSPVLDAGGRVVAASVIARDITERRQAEREQEESHRALQALLMDMPLYGVIMNSSERIEFCNRALAAVVGAEPAQLVGVPWDDVFGDFPEDQQAWRIFTEEGRITPQYDGRLRDGDGQVRDVFWSNVAYEEGSSEMLLASVGQDVTAARAATEQLAQAMDERERLLGAVLAAESGERARLAEALHDDTIQALTATLVQLDVALTDNTQDTPVLRARETLASALARVRGLMFELRPHVLDERGLAAAVKLLADQVSRDSGISVEVEIPLTRFEPSLEELVYRTIREALINAARHSGASQVRISLSEQGGQLGGLVEDDGAGFDMEHVRARDDANLHFGLRSMIERVRVAHGTVDVRSGPGAGTSVSFSLPTG